MATTLIFVWHAAQVAVASEHWSTSGWRHTTPEDQGMSSKLLANLLGEVNERKYRIDSVTVVRNGYVVLDAYFHPFKKGLKHIIHSDTKSVMSALIGIAIDRGEIKSVHQPVTGFFPGRTIANFDDRKRAMTLEHLLTMTSGLNCRDRSRDGWLGLSRMLNSPDWTQYVLDMPMAQAPGQQFRYCNGASFLLSAILQNATNTSAFGYANTHLFGPLGIKDVYWRNTSKGVTVGYGEMYMHPHDMAKFGWLYLNKGRWAGRQIVPNTWVETSTRRHVETSSGRYYGYQWWGDASGYYMALGYRGQQIIVVPAKNLVVVFTSDLGLPNIRTPRNLLEQFIIPAVRSNSPLPTDRKQQSRLRDLVNNASAGPTEDIIWRTASDGLVRGDVFIRTAPPAFTLRIPPGSRMEAVLPEYPNRLMQMQAISGFRFSASLTTVPEAATLRQVGPDVYAAKLKIVTPNLNVTANQKIQLKNGTSAYLTEISWRERGRHLTRYLVSAFNNGKWVYVEATTWTESKHAYNFVRSLRFR